MAIGTLATFTSSAKSKWGGNMKVGDLVLFADDPTIGVIVEIRCPNGDCCCLFNGEIYLCASSSLEVINASR